MSESDRIYGIDLGTTFSCIARVDEHGKPSVVNNAESQATTPSVVYFENADNIVVGEAAKEVSELYPDEVVSTVKRVMGDPDWIFEAHGKTHSPQDVSSYILRKLVSNAETNTGDTIKDVVITCPAYFGVNEKEATRQAGELAGLNVRYIIPEPTAAAIAYGIEQTEEQVILVYDLGGGTFDITLIAITPEGVTVVCTGGDHQLGGRNWDETIAQWMAEQFSNEAGTPADDLMADRETWQNLLKLSEKGKISLSSRETYKTAVVHDVDRVKISLSRETFESITSHLLERTLSLTDELLKTAADKGYMKIDKLLLVGGSTYMPQVERAVRERFPSFDVTHEDPHQVVAKGAALFGFKCQLDDEIERWIRSQTNEDPGEVSEEIIEEAEKEVALKHGLALPGLRKLTRPTITNVTAKSFGIIVMDAEHDEERVTNLIVVNEQVPVSISKQFGTYEDDQEGVTLRCMENTLPNGPEGPTLELDSSVEVGTAELRFSRPLPKGSPIEITFALAEDGLLSIHGRDLTTNREIDAQFKTAAILIKEEMEEKKSRNMAITVI